jgi:hypothetical protein
MNTTGQTKSQPITRDHWMDLVARHALPLTAPQFKRRHYRYPSLSSARVAFALQRGARVVTAIRRCKVMQISAEGLTLRSQERIPLRAQLAIELHTTEPPSGKGLFLVFGTVIHCTQTADAFKVGVQLLFSEP